jgi:DNA recombination protein RmuC
MEILIALVALAVGALLGYFYARNQAGATKTEFEALAAAALRSNNESFVALAQQTMARFHQQAEGELAKRELSVANMVKPIGEALAKTHEQIQQLEKQREHAYGSLQQYLKTMQESQTALTLETRNLATALRKPDVRGRYGELTLQRVVELAGMTEHCDFSQQETVSSDSGALRPDLVVRMPGARAIVVDAKFPLDAYLDALEAKDEAAKRAALDRHARALRERVRALASKSYGAQFAESPEFVVLFVPGDQFLSAALERDAELQEDALRDRVVLATTNSFMALLKVIAFGWRQQQLESNAERIRELGEDLYKRLATFAGHLADVGDALEKAAKAHNKAVGSYENRLLPGARKFTELGVDAKTALPEVERVETLANRPADADK